MSTDVLDRPAQQPAAAPTALRFAPLTPLIGSEVSGIDLRDELDASTVAALRQALVDRKVLFFRDQPITDAEQVRFSRYFGGVTPAHPVTNGISEEQPEVKRNVKSEPEVKRGSSFTEAEAQLWRAQSRPHRARGWHTDITFLANPADFSLLRGVKIPPVGGDTAWADLEALYDSLSPALQRFADTLQVAHARYDAAAGHPPPPRWDGRTSGPFLAIHPLVRVHPESGRKALFVGGFAKYIVGLSESESDTLLTYFKEELAGRLDLHVRFRWTPDSLAVWDNRSTVHWGPVDGRNFHDERIVHRTTVGASHATGPDGFVSRQVVGEPFYTLD
ncbi:TauD/TfdA dioxygenase family protein [Xylophilus sp.]|uniref:TauD/TfdA dioxygenase family protein n=1 Tax=Xylophilus sp. TaxID=2653893 RepID=UPI0013B6BC20|nr:TauD/TfdA family dioxygenase [Xylophilus sp.]KAF1049181.1 MAG: Alkylsulfatase [Xylophilus sp.]